MAGQRLDGIAHSFVDGVSRRDAARHVRKTDAVDPVRFLMDESYVAHADMYPTVIFEKHNQFSAVPLLQRSLERRDK
jgi:hypothetical protein